MPTYMTCIEVDSRYSQSNETIAIGVLRDLDLHFKGQLYNVNILVKVRARRKMRDTTLIELDICRRMTTLPYVVLGNLDLNFQGQTFKTLISRKR